MFKRILAHNGPVCYKNVNNCLNTNIFSCLEISGGLNYNLYLNVGLFSTPVWIRHLWQHETVVFLHWCLIRTVNHAKIFSRMMLRRMTLIKTLHINCDYQHNGKLIIILRVTLLSVILLKVAAPTFGNEKMSLALSWKKIFRLLKWASLV